MMNPPASNFGGGRGGNFGNNSRGGRCGGDFRGGRGGAPRGRGRGGNAVDDRFNRTFGSFLNQEKTAFNASPFGNQQAPYKKPPFDGHSGDSFRGRGFPPNFNSAPRGRGFPNSNQSVRGGGSFNFNNNSRGGGNFNPNFRGRGYGGPGGMGMGGDHAMGMINQQNQQDSSNDIFELPTAGPISEENKLIPQNHVSFFQTGTQQVAGPLIQQYLSKFQNNRDSLFEAYDKNSTFTITTVNGGEVPYKTSFADTEVQGDQSLFNAMKEHQRAVWERRARKFVNPRPEDEHKNKANVFVGKYAIIAELEKLPKITVGKELKADCVILGPTSLMIVIHGTMSISVKDVGKTTYTIGPEFNACPDTPLIYAFDRTFVFDKPSDQENPSPEWPLKITSDTLHVRPAMKYHEDTQKYQQPKADQFAALASSQPQQTQQTRQPLPHPQQEIDFKQLESTENLNPQQLKMIYDVTGGTKIKVAEAHALLGFCEWNMEKAGTMYSEYQQQGKLGSDVYYQ